jgi:hypothetical protein
MLQKIKTKLETLKAGIQTKINPKVLTLLKIILLVVVTLSVWVAFYYGLDYLVGGLSLAAAPVVGVAEDAPVTHQQIEEDTDILEVDFPREVEDIGQDLYLITTMTDRIKNIHTTESIETGVHENGDLDIDDITTATTAATTTNLVNMSLSKHKIWKPNDTLIIPEVQVNGKPLMLCVLSNSGTNVTCMAANPDTSNSIPSIPQNASVKKLGKAMNELAAQAKSTSGLPVPFTNYCQTFMETVIVSKRALKAKKKVNVDYKFLIEQQIREFKKRRELSYLIGVKGKQYDEDNNEIFFCDGVFNAAQNSYTMTSNVFTNAMYVNMCKMIFTSSNGSDERVLLAGADFMEMLENVEQYRKQLDAKNVEVVFGVKATKIVTDFGMLNIRYHRLLDGYYANKAIALDMPYIRKDVFDPFLTEDLELQKSGQMRAKAKNISETSCLVLENQYAHCVIDVL